MQALARTMQRLHAGRGVTFDVQAGEALAFKGEPQDLYEMLGNLMDNAGKWAAMEIEYFVDPEYWQEAFDELLAATHEFLAELGLKQEHIHELDVPAEDRAHYSKKTIDIEYDYPIGREELMGIAYRTDFDLMNIQRVSGKSMEYTVKGTNTKFVPHVIEPSFGVERAPAKIGRASCRERV